MRDETIRVQPEILHVTFPQLVSSLMTVQRRLLGHQDYLRYLVRSFLENLVTKACIKTSRNAS